ncbi:MAG TPA: discoidin domain-containing protein, partial [Bacilli bacterium]
DMPVFVLDYADSSDKALLQRVYDRAWEFGFIPYVSNKMLDQVFVYDIRPQTERGAKIGKEMSAYGDKPDPSTDPNNLALASNGAVVEVDSTFPNYTKTPLNDGYRNEPTLTWDEIAWASGLIGDNHWAEIKLPKQANIGRVDIYWALDNGQYMTSQECEIQVKKNGEWVTVQKVAEPEGNKELSSIKLENPVQADDIRIWQNSGKGPLNYPNPNIIWIAEIEIYEAQ